MSDMSRVILGRQPGKQSSGIARFVEGRVRSTSAAGTTFTIPTWDGGQHLFGPAPWPLDYIGGVASSAPPVGSRCLVVFVGTGIGNPWIVGWWPA